MSKSLKLKFLLITYGLCLFFVLQNFETVSFIFSKITSLLMPFVYGFFIAYFVDWPRKFFEEKFYKKCFHSPKLIKLFSILTSYLSFLIVISFLLVIVIPQLVVSVVNLVNKFSEYSSFFKNMSLQCSDIIKNKFGLELDLKSHDLIKNILNIDVNFIIPIVFNYVKNFTVVLYNWVLGIIVSIYFLWGKEKLISDIKKVFYVCFNNTIYNGILNVFRISHNVFGKFIIGKIIDSLIIGFLCFIGTSIMKMPYALIISTIVGITNIIPFFGPFFGAIPSIFIIFMISPIKAVWFAVFILVLQQIDGNIIGPKILGESIGISAIFIMFSVILGGGLFGVSGMILGVPIFVVVYIIFSNWINKKLGTKKDL